MSKRDNIIIEETVLNPSNGEHATLPEQFLWRSKGIFEGPNRIVICDTKESIWWNRPITSDTLYRVESDGLYSYNLPLLDNIAEFKSGYNLLLGKNTIAYAAHIKFDDTWTEEQKQALYNLSYKVLYDSLVELGVDKTRLTQQNNDTAYDGKKFAGGEKIIKNNVFTENFVITLQVLPEKEIFARLTGKYVANKKITGIEEEDSRITKKILMDKMYEKIVAFFEALK